MIFKFCQFFVDFEEFFVGGRLGCQNSMLSAEHYVLKCNQLKSSFLRRAVMAEWLTRLTMNPRVAGSSHSGPLLL